MRTLLLVIKLSVWAALLFGVILMIAAFVVPEISFVPGFAITAFATATLIVRRGCWAPLATPKIIYRGVDDKYDVPPGEWYRLRKWSAVSYFMFRAEPAAGWRRFSEYEPVVGLTHGDREKSFFRIFQKPEFRLFLQREPENPHDPHAVAVMGTAVVRGRQEIHHIGYIAKETARELPDSGDLGVLPFGLWIPGNGTQFGLRIVILIREGQRENVKPAGRGKASGAR